MVVGGHFGGAQAEEFCLNVVDRLLELDGRHRAFGTGDGKALVELVAAVLFAFVVLFDHGEADPLDALVGGEAALAVAAAAAALDRFSVLGEAAVGDLCIFVVAIRTLHAMYHPGVLDILYVVFSNTRAQDVVCCHIMPDLVGSQVGFAQYLVRAWESGEFSTIYCEGAGGIPDYTAHLFYSQSVGGRIRSGLAACEERSTRQRTAARRINPRAGLAKPACAGYFTSGFPSAILLAE